MSSPVQWRMAGVAALILGMTGAAQAATTVYSNNVGGDSFTNSSGSNQGQAVGSSGWYYNNVRADGVAGISTAYPRNGNGSVGFSGPANAKADIEFLSGAVNALGNFYATTSLGNFADLASMSYDWYRNSVSTAPDHFHPSLRVLVDIDGNVGNGGQAYLIFERAYNPSVTPVPTDQWVSESVGSSTILWGSGALQVGGNPLFQDLATWKSQLSNAVILGFSSGIGSGWSGTFEGAVDNIGWNIGGNVSSYNFEVSPVPEPSGYVLALFSLGVIAAFARRRSSPRA